MILVKNCTNFVKLLRNKLACDSKYYFEIYKAAEFNTRI